MPESDVLDELERVLAKVPENAAIVPPMSRKTVAAAAAEIRKLRMVIGSVRQLKEELARRNGEAGGTGSK